MTRLTILGCGSMATGILKGMMRHYPERTLPVSHISACVRSEASVDRLRRLFDSQSDIIKPVLNDNVKAVADADIVMLGLKPYQLNKVLGETGMADALRGKKIISILAGISSKQIEEALGPKPSLDESSRSSKLDIVRAMPNIGANIGESMTLLSELDNASPELVKFTKRLFDSVGRTAEVTNTAYDAASVLTGAAYALTTVALEGMVEGSVQQGLPRTTALEIAAQCFKGLATMIQQGKHPAEVRDYISSPSGVTITGIVELNKGAVRSDFAQAIIRATEQAKTMGQKQD